MTTLLKLVAPMTATQIALRDWQRTTVDMLINEIAKGGDFTFKAPVGCGASLIVASALKQYNGRVLVVSNLSELHRQFIEICARVNVGNHVSHVLRYRPSKPLNYELIVLNGGRQTLNIDHPRILRF